jgi:hypothetical protein
MNPITVVDSYPEYHLHQSSLESYLQGIFVGSTIKVEVSTQGVEWLHSPLESNAHLS